MFIYCQRSGLFFHNSKLIERGYSGKDDGDGILEPGEGKNTPEAQNIKSVGPIPRGLWDIGPAFKHATKGNVVMRLTPKSSTTTFNRDAFLIHGDSVKNPGAGSEGCIILSLAGRNYVAASKDNVLWVVDTLIA